MEYHNTGFNRTNENSCQNIRKYMIPDDYFLSICKKNQTIQIDIRQLIDDKPTENGILLNQRQWEYIQISSTIPNAIKRAAFDPSQ
jgi:hypothetical protein